MPIVYRDIRNVLVLASCEYGRAIVADASADGLAKCVEPRCACQRDDLIGPFRRATAAQVARFWRPAELQRPSVKERLAERINMILRVIGYAEQGVTVTPDQLESTHAGYGQRSAGAWSWGANIRMQLGSQHPMNACIAGPTTAAFDHIGSLVIGPAEPRDGAPKGAVIGVNVALDGLPYKYAWYDAEGLPIKS